MKLTKYLLGIFALCMPFAATAQTFLGKRLIVDANVGTSSQLVRPFDLDEQFLWIKGEPDYFNYGSLENYYLNEDGNFKEMDARKFWDFNLFCSVDAEVILWKKGSAILEARMAPYTDFYFKGPQVVKYNEFTVQKAQERSFEAGLGYRQYMFSSSTAPFGRYIQVGLNKVQVQWKKGCTNINNLLSEDTYNKQYLVEESKDALKTEQKSGYNDLWAGYLELGYNHLFFNNHLRLSLSMRTEFPFGYDAYESVCPNADYYSIRHFWSSNFLSLKAGVGYVIF